MTDTMKSTEIALARPDITQREIDAVVAVLRTPNLSLGPKVVEFEAKFAKLCQTRHAVACNSGTSALHLLIRAMGIKEGDEVITTPFSFVASSNCALFENALPVFADIDPDTWCIDPNRLEEAITPRTKAIIPVHLYGHPADMDAINAIARRHRLIVVEDAAEAHGAKYRGKPAGSLADVTEPIWREAWDLKVFGYINLGRELYPRMVARGQGVIMNVIFACVMAAVAYSIGVRDQACGVSRSEEHTSELQSH